MSDTMKAAAILACSILASCSPAQRTIPAAGLGSADTILIYERGRPVVKRPISADSEEDRAVLEWLRSHADGWRSDPNTYAPGQYVRGPRFTLNFHTGRCILNYRAEGDEGWTQVSRTLREGESEPEIFGRPG